VKTFSLVSLAALVLAHAALAEVPSIEHPTCKVLPLGSITAQAYGKVIGSRDLNWATEDEVLALRFREHGYVPGDYKSAADVADGGLFAILTYGCAPEPWNNKVVYRCRAEVEIRQQDSTQPKGNLLLGHASSPGVDQHFTIDGAKRDELVEALKGIPKCVVKAAAAPAEKP
jgi:hypothetical protein